MLRLSQGLTLQKTPEEFGVHHTVIGWLDQHQKQ
jgi:hypothetical protein